MSDDIVTRLRATGIVEPPLVTPEEAADEIERLRVENAFLRKALVRYGCEYVDIISAVTEWGENE